MSAAIFIIVTANIYSSRKFQFCKSYWRDLSRLTSQGVYVLGRAFHKTFVYSRLSVSKVKVGLV